MSASAVPAPRRRPAWIPAVEASALALFAWGWGDLAAAVAAATDGPRAGAAVAAAAIAALVTADLVSGIGHWLCDRFFDERAPIVGPLVVRSFREHHVAPDALVRHGFVELNGDSALVCLPLLLATTLLPPPDAGLPALAAHAFAAAFLLAILLTNSVHRWAHADRAPRPVAWLQRRGVLLRPDDHARHHRGDHRLAYCITTGWLNPVLDRTAFFDRLERGLGRLGAPPSTR